MARRSDNSLSPTALNAMSKSLSLASTVLGFDIVELWSDAGDGKGLHCTFAHASDEQLSKHPSIIYGYYPKHQKPHKLSPLLCEICRKAEKRYHWRVIRDGDLGSEDPGKADWLKAYQEVHLPIKTEMAYLLDGEYGGASIFIVGLAFDVIYFKQSKLRFLSGLGYAIYVAAFDFDDEDEADSEMDREHGSHELDVKEFLPQRPLLPSAFPSTANLASHGSMGALHDAPDLGLGVWGKNLSSAILMNSPRDYTDTIVTVVNDNDSPRLRSESNLSDVGLRLDSPRQSQTAADIVINKSVGKVGSLHGHGDSSHHIGFQLSVHSGHGGKILPSVRSGVNIASLPHDSTSSKRVQVPILRLDQLSLASSPPSVGLIEAVRRGSGDSTKLSLHPSLSYHNSVANSQGNLHGFGLALRTASSHDHEDCSANDITRHSENSALNAALANIPPTWEPGAPFSFPVAEIPIKYHLMDDLTLAQLTDIRHLADGSNANIFLGKLGSDQVIIKMIKEEALGNPVAMHEFDLEHGMLCRISHPHIIRVLGAGRIPRRFIVLEYLGGGSLNNILAENQSKPGLAQRLFHRPTFTFLELLQKARDMADALEYLHTQCHPGATIIHRDLKPDNVGFTLDGKVKLFDFGLSTCVRTRIKGEDAYEMTGYTGSLRYMAPEVALRQPYTEKVDVYSFSIMLWQMARDRVPFKGFNKDIFMKQVVRYNDRPKLDSTWPPAFSSLLSDCWSRDPARRPSFTDIKARLDRLIEEESNPNRKVRKPRPGKNMDYNAKSPPSTAPHNNSWF